LPAVSVPCATVRAEGENGFRPYEKSNMPIGVQLIGRRFDDVNLLGFARVFERESGMSNLIAEVK